MKPVTKSNTDIRIVIGMNILPSTVPNVPANLIIGCIVATTASIATKPSLSGDMNDLTVAMIPLIALTPAFAPSTAVSAVLPAAPAPAAAAGNIVSALNGARKPLIDANVDLTGASKSAAVSAIVN